MNKSKYTHVIWDFNGTIFDDVEAGIKSVNKMLEERGLDIIPSPEYYRTIFDFPIEEYYRGLGFDFEKEPYEFLAPIWVDLYNKNAQSSVECYGVSDTMKKIREMGLSQMVLSACEINMLNSYLEKLGLADYLCEVIGLDNIHARSKIEQAKAWKEKNPNAKAIMIGDTTHDYETAKTLSADCVLYAGGHQSREKLSACGCPVVDSIQELLNYL